MTEEQAERLIALAERIAIALEPTRPVNPIVAPAEAVRDVIRDKPFAIEWLDGKPPTTSAVTLPAKRGRKPAAPKPSAEPDPEIFRERGAVAGFIRSDGTEWKWPGPRPGEPGCLIRASVLAEFSGRIEAAAELGRQKAEMERTFGRL